MLKGIKNRNHAWHIHHIAKMKRRALIRKQHILMKTGAIEMHKNRIAKQINKKKEDYLVWWRKVILFIKKIFIKQNAIR